jgi:hypothetical protein
MKVERMMGLMAMKIDRDRDDGHMGKGQGDQHLAPPRQIEYSRIAHDFPRIFNHMDKNIFSASAIGDFDLRQEN